MVDAICASLGDDPSPCLGGGPSNGGNLLEFREISDKILEQFSARASEYPWAQGGLHQYMIDMHALMQNLIRNC